jgi:N-acyl-D-aspartate/D-glutamate deacylase
VSPAEAFLDMAVETDAKGLWNYPFLNFDFDAIEAKIKDPNVILGIGDAGAHFGQIQDASQSTYFLTAGSATPTPGRSRRASGCSVPRGPTPIST